MSHFWVVGTDTDVGKTAVTCALLRNLQQQGLQVSPFKPVQTGEVVMEGQRAYYDTAMYESFSLQTLSEENINIYSFKEAASPHYAAKLENVQMNVKVILKKMTDLQQQYDGLIVEGAGGLYVPLDTDSNYTLLDLIEQSNLPVVLVARTKLGTINHTMLSLEVLRSRKIEVLGIVFNGYEQSDMETNNIETIVAHSVLSYAVVPKLPNVEQLKTYSFENSSLWERLLKA